MAVYDFTGGMVRGVQCPHDVVLVSRADGVVVDGFRGAFKQLSEVTCESEMISFNFKRLGPHCIGTAHRIISGLEIAHLYQNLLSEKFASVVIQTLKLYGHWTLRLNHEC